MFNSRHEGFLRGAGGKAISVIAFAAITLSACAAVGPASIDHGRTSYNEVIEDTSRQQALLNVVRVSKGELPLFMDVTEVDAATSVGGSARQRRFWPRIASPNLKSTSAGTIAGPVESDHRIGILSGGADRSLFPSFRKRSDRSGLNTDKAGLACQSLQFRLAARRDT